MKKIWFSLLLVAAMSANAQTNAQTFDETDLIGTWTTTGFTYALYKILNIESITLGFGEYERGVASGLIKNMTYIDFWDNRENTRDQKIFDYFISNNNKLHITVEDAYVMHFIIEELSASSMKLKTYDGQSYTFTKDNSSSEVKPMTLTSSSDDSIYNINGQKVDDVTTNGVYIQNGQKKVVKK
ncbi:MAG: hypothetical protein IKW78_08640 [Prevotella sp.]|nr:hypothetical protein [Prevotella sp.]